MEANLIMNTSMGASTYNMVLDSVTSLSGYVTFGVNDSTDFRNHSLQFNDISYDNITSDLINGTASASHVNTKSHFYQNEQVGFLIFLFIGILIGNTSVLLAIGVSKRGHKSRMTFFIMHLAISDLLVGFVSVLTDLIWKVTVYWYAGNIMCHIVRYLQGVAMFASTYVLVALSIDRLEAIARPMSFSSSRVRARILVTLAWVLSALMALPMVVLNKEMGEPGHTQCGMKLPSLYYWQLYVVLLASALFFIPTLIISICYCVIISVIWSKSKVLNSSSRAPFIKRFSSRHKQDGAADTKREHSKKVAQTESKSSSRGVIPQAKIRTIKMTLVIVIVFIVCWSPYFIFNILDVFGYIPWNSTYHRRVRILLQSFAPLNSLVNPIIYGIFSTRVCRNLRRIKAVNWLLVNLCCCFDCSSWVENTGSIYTSNTYSTRANSSSRRVGRSSTTHSTYLSHSQNNRSFHGNSQNNHSFPGNNHDTRQNNHSLRGNRQKNHSLHRNSQNNDSLPGDSHGISQNYHNIQINSQGNSQNNESIHGSRHGNRTDHCVQSNSLHNHSLYSNHPSDSQNSKIPSERTDIQMRLLNNGQDIDVHGSRTSSTT